MLTTQLRNEVNNALAGEQLSLKMMLPHLNFAIDQINSTLNTVFPVFTESTTEYTAFPDKWIRQVVVPAAAHHYFVVDDEGRTSEQNFSQLYQQGLFFMLRDYSHCIPDEYLDDEDNGTVNDAWEVRGIWL